MKFAPVKFQKLICQNPYVSLTYNSVFPCGKCVLCRARRARQWTHRLALESTDWSRVCHVTLTYAARDDGHDFDFNLAYPDFQLFMKRFRKFLDSIGYGKIKFFCAGEKGERNTQRVHFHVLLFGVDHVMRDVITSKWREGFIKLRTVDSQRGMRKVAAYVSQYVLKKIGNKKDGMQHCSNGIGLKAAMRLFRETFKAHYQKFGDFQPIVWQGEVMRLDRYIKTKIAESLGILEELKSRWKQKAKDFLEEVLSIYDTFSQDYVFGRPPLPEFSMVGPYEEQAFVNYKDFTDSQLYKNYLLYVNSAIEFVGQSKFEAYEKMVLMRQKKNNRGFFASVCKNVI